MNKKVEVSYNPQLGYLKTIFTHNFDSSQVSSAIPTGETGWRWKRVHTGIKPQR